VIAVADVVNSVITRPVSIGIASCVDAAVVVDREV